MGKMELEVKILNVNKDEFIEKLNKLGAIFVSESKQLLYTYDLPTSYSRYIDILEQLNNPESLIKYETALEKLRLLFFDLDNLLEDAEKIRLEQIINSTLLTNLLDRSDLLNVLNTEEMNSFMKQFQINENKWVRIRKTNEKSTIAVKHILAGNGSVIQQLHETEFVIPSLEEGNDLLQALGFSYKSYQEKLRTTYLYEGHEIDIDTWPEIPTYVEVEGESEEDLKVYLTKFGYSIEDTISCSANEVFRMHGKSMFDERELKFKD
jgi:Adenylate cyclase, class 2 (thermophilic)